MSPHFNWPFGQDPNTAWKQMFESFSQPDWQPWQSATSSTASDPLKPIQDMLTSWLSAMPGSMNAQSSPWAPSQDAMLKPFKQAWEQYCAALTDMAASAGASSRSPLPSWREALTMQPAPLGANRETIRQLQDHAAANGEMLQAVQAMQDALAPFMATLQQRLTSASKQLQDDGKTLDSLRGMIDFWVDAAEDAYAEIAHSPAFTAALGRFTNAFTRLKQQRQTMLDQHLEVIGLPTRAELQTSHERLQRARRDIRLLQREMAELRREMASTTTAPPVAEASSTAAPAPRKAAAKKAAARKTAPTAAAKRAATARRQDSNDQE